MSYFYGIGASLAAMGGAFIPPPPTATSKSPLRREDSVEIARRAIINRPKSTTEKLQGLGLSEGQARALSKTIADDSDTPYFGGRLRNGKVYVITNNDQVYYGKPDNLQKLKIEASRTRCTDQQKRTYQSDNGLTFQVNYHKGKKTSQVSRTKPLPILGSVSVPKRHKQRVDLTPNQ